MDYLQALRGIARRIADARRQAAARQEFLQLDPRTVHDLGMSASEFDSFWAEAHGEAERTRVRIGPRRCET